MSRYIIDDSVDFLPIKRNGKLYKKCSKCHGSGKETPIMAMVIIPGINDDKKPNKPGLFVCRTCGGSGLVPLIDPIILKKY